MERVDLCKRKSPPGETCHCDIYIDKRLEVVVADLVLSVTENSSTTWHLPLSVEEARRWGALLMFAADELEVHCAG